MAIRGAEGCALAVRRRSDSGAAWRHGGPRLGRTQLRIGVVTFLSAGLEPDDPRFAAVVHEAGGRVVPQSGHALAVFGRATAAVAASLPLRTALGDRVSVPVTVATMEVDRSVGAAPVVARLRALLDQARPGRTLVAAVTAQLIADDVPSGAVLHDTDERVAGAADPGDAVFELQWEQLVKGVVSDVAGRDLPPGLAVIRGPFVGRRAELSRLRDRWAMATNGSLQAVFVGGEPGIGKTRLAAQLALEAADPVPTVLFGRCDEHLSVPYQPFVEALTPYLLSCSADVLAVAGERHALEVTRLSLNWPID